MEDWFLEDEGVISLFPSTLNEVCISIEPGLSPGYAAFTPSNARLIAARIMEIADWLEQASPSEH